MDILVRRFDNESYVWKKAKFVNGQIMADGTQIYENNIVSIRNDERKKYVYCDTCGTYFKKGSKKIEEHKEGYKDSRMCFECRYMRQNYTDIRSQKFELLDNGKYRVKAKSEASLRCGRSSSDINSEKARERCIYNRCKDANMYDARGFFLDKPGAFDHIITVDKVLEAGYKSAWHDSYSGSTYYTLKGRIIIEAIVNKLNIVEGFRVNYKRQQYMVYYSKKYNKLYSNNYGDSYREWTPSGMLSDTKQYIFTKIAELYN